MEKLPKLRQVLTFLAREPERVIAHYWSSRISSYNKNIERLVEALELYERASTFSTSNASGACAYGMGQIDQLMKDHTKSSYQWGSKLEIGESLLHELFCIAMGPSSAAGYACYQLGCIFDKREAPYRITPVTQSYCKAAYFYGLALQKGYLEPKAKKAYGEACAHLGWYDTALNWYPETVPEYDLVKAFLKHRIRFCKENGVRFPKTEHGFVCFAENGEAKQLKNAFLEKLSLERDFVKNMQALEDSFPEDVLKITKKLDQSEQELIQKKKRSKIKWWLLVPIVALCIAMGVLAGNGTGLQGISYKFFMILSAFCAKPYLPDMDLGQLLNSNLDVSLRAVLATVIITTHTLSTLVWVNFLKIFGRKKYAKEYETDKYMLYLKYEIGDRLEKSKAIGQLVSFDVTNFCGRTFKTPNDFVLYLTDLWVQHSAAAKVPAPIRDYEYGLGESTGAYADHNEFLEDYGTFMEYLKLLKGTNVYMLPWSGQEVGRALFSVARYKREDFRDYFCQMYCSGIAIAESKGKSTGYLDEQIKAVHKGFYEANDDRPVASFAPRNQSSSHDSSEDDNGKDFDRLMNLAAYGAYGTDQEVFNEMHLRGKLSDDDYNKAMTYNWRLSDLDDDGT